MLVKLMSVIVYCTGCPGLVRRKHDPEWATTLAHPSTCTFPTPTKTFLQAAAHKVQLEYTCPPSPLPPRPPTLALQPRIKCNLSRKKPRKSPRAAAREAKLDELPAL